MSYCASEREEVRDRLNLFLSGPAHSFSPSFPLAASFLVLGSSLFSPGFALWSFKILFSVCFLSMPQKYLFFQDFCVCCNLSLLFRRPPPCCREGGKVLKVHWGARKGNKMGGRKWTLKHVYSIHVDATNLASATHEQYRPERN